MHLLLSMSFCHTSPAQPHSEQPHSTPDPPETSSLGDSANHRPAYWEGVLHHQMANPKKKLTQNSSATRVMHMTLACVFQALLPPRWCHLSPEAPCHRWYHRPGRLWWRRNASGPERKGWRRENLTDWVKDDRFLKSFEERQIYIWHLYKGAECAVCRVVCDQEPHVFVAQFHWSRTIHGGQRAFWPKAIHFLIYRNNIWQEKLEII